MIRTGLWVTCALAISVAACGGKNNGDDDGNDNDADSDADNDDNDNDNDSDADSDDTPIDAQAIDAAIDAPDIDAAIDAPPPAFTVGGTLVGLTTGIATVSITTPGGTNQLMLTADGPFEFGPYANGTSYTVTVGVSVGTPQNTCFVGNKMGTLNNADVTNVRVECAEPDLRITEVATCFYANVSCWIEVHNPTTTARSLANYTMRSQAVNLGNSPPTGIGSQTFTLPALNVPAGGYVLVRGRATSDSFSGPAVAAIASAQIVPIWGAAGYVELIRASRTVDYVTFGGNITPPTSVGWDGANVTALPAGDMLYGSAIVRTNVTADTNTSGDWAHRASTTPAGPNDITNDTDADADGIPDQAETSGGTFAGVDLYAMGARTGRRDVFVQIDRMQSADPGVIPRREALQRIVDVFNTHNIAVHFDAGNLFAAGFDPANFNLGGGNLLAFSQFLHTGTAAGAANLHEIKAANFDVRLTPVFHYMIFGYQSSSPPAGGRAELFGNDVIITQGNVGLQTTPAAQLNYLINSQAEVVMHELGHNLGLAHGGDIEVNGKPNYLSTMNYLYAYRGMPTIGNAEGDRYYLQRGGCGVTSDTQLTNNPYGTTHILDFSSGGGTALNEASLTEATGLGRVGSISVDWNCNGAANTGLALDINGDGTQTSLTDYNDWGNLRSAFARSVAGNARGPRGRIDPLVNDVQPVVIEDAGFFLRRP